MESGPHVKSVKITLNIFAVCPILNRKILASNVPIKQDIVRGQYLDEVNEIKETPNGPNHGSALCLISNNLDHTQFESSMICTKFGFRKIWIMHYLDLAKFPSCKIWDCAKSG